MLPNMMAKVQKKKIMCPVCSCKLLMKQINLDTAVYLCSKSDCVYPYGHSWIVVNRSMSQLYKDTQRKLKRRKVLNADKILDNVTSGSASTSSNHASILNDLRGIGGEENQQQQDVSAVVPSEADASLMDCSILNQTELCNEFNFDEMINGWKLETPCTSTADSSGMDFDLNNFLEEFPVQNTEVDSSNHNGKRFARSLSVMGEWESVSTSSDQADSSGTVFDYNDFPEEFPVQIAKVDSSVGKR